MMVVSESADLFRSVRTVAHASMMSSGHFVPTTTSFRRLFRSYIKSYDQAAKQATASAESQ